jgi:hypothetical protein
MVAAFNAGPASRNQLFEQWQASGESLDELSLTIKRQRTMLTNTEDDYQFMSEADLVAHYRGDNQYVRTLIENHMKAGKAWRNDPNAPPGDTKHRQYWVATRSCQRTSDTTSDTTSLQGRTDRPSAAVLDQLATVLQGALNPSIAAAVAAARGGSSGATSAPAQLPAATTDPTDAAQSKSKHKAKAKARVTAKAKGPPPTQARHIRNELQSFKCVGCFCPSRFRSCLLHLLLLVV